jgi:hypothetical protein
VKPACDMCGGPLFRTRCYGLCTAPAVKGVRRAHSYTESTGGDGVRDYSLTWEPTYLSPKGQPLNVARWIPYAETPAGRIDVWHRLLARVA